jgi:hypothetical protein
MQNAILGTIKVTGDAVKQLGMSIESKRLPWLPVSQSPGFSQRQDLRADRSNIGGKDIDIPYRLSTCTLTT